MAGTSRMGCAGAPRRKMRLHSLIGNKGETCETEKPKRVSAALTTIDAALNISYPSTRTSIRMRGAPSKTSPTRSESTHHFHTTFSEVRLNFRSKRGADLGSLLTRLVGLVRNDARCKAVTGCRRFDIGRRPGRTSSARSLENKGTEAGAGRCLRGSSRPLHDSGGHS